MASTSKAVNLKSFVNYVISLCKYFDGASLSADNKTQLFDYLTEGVSNTSVAINVKTGLAVINKLKSIISGSPASFTVTVTNGNLSSLLSVNSARTLINKAFANSATRYNFMTPARVFNTTNLTAYNRLQWELALPASSTFTNNELIGTLYGGGGGGSGGVGGDGGKGSSFTVTSGAGATGGTSTITYNTTTITADGGVGGSSVSQTASGDVSIAQSGNAGRSGGTKEVKLAVQPKTTIIIKPGYGGGGGGACSARYSGSKTYTGNSATTVVGANGYAGDNSWSGEDYTFAGGGGEGGKGTGYSGMGYGSNSAGGAGAPTTYSATNQSNGVGGRGGYTSNTSQPAQPATMGAGGYGGTASYSNNVWDCSNGGNGGNAGGFVVNSSCSAYNTLFVYRGTLTV